MREIKFRGRRIDNGEWVEGDLIRFYEEAVGGDCPQDESCCCIQEPQESLSLFDVDPATVGQFTGPKDKNGVEIYDLCEPEEGEG